MDNLDKIQNIVDRLEKLAEKSAEKHGHEVGSYHSTSFKLGWMLGQIRSILIQHPEAIESTEGFVLFCEKDC